jgi:hypothetical protein
MHATGHHRRGTRALSRAFLPGPKLFAAAVGASGSRWRSWAFLETRWRQHL